ncbi:MAG: hypothetical protein J7J77_00925 [Candidatus Cloacimonetes bacterium]|nr:hypothetical protein [Candidatus Cloacimonadota bacterium]
MKVKDYVTDKDVLREIWLDESDLEFIVEGYEFEEDEMKEMDTEPEFEGDYFYKRFKTFREAVKKYLELLEMGWEVVRFSIHIKTPNKLNNIGLKLDFYVGEFRTSLGVMINTTKLCENYAKKLIEIEKILRKVEP